MAGLDALLARLEALGARGAERNTAAELADRARAELALDGLIARLAHPAGSATVPVEPASGDQRVA